MILLLDNYDSFTFNLFQYIGELGETILVVRNDRFTIEEIRTLQPKAIVLSPGPGKPEDAGICMEVVKELHAEYPILGICLGHQAIAQAFGGVVRKAKRVMHGKVSLISHKSNGLFVGLPESIEVMRYHSLSADEETLPSELIVDATVVDDGEIMAFHHIDYPIYGLQFHPESIGTLHGKHLLKNFILKIAVLEDSVAF
ncbi:aminodeoxychorismate/anthranilate synthase component II [Bacillus sp. FJAT-27225]|uniref:anthranilate synthase component II n=1 Tax=Bacillus sp. FJAT-27225 TaxID=1743144 RepID=UPI00080C2429|nr:aminodeoxychorismate/anthranilate synthase component II [Bacillus sp. FJAT-27225]OCA90799.1 aminodeoxychorismate/anthranilate synthase component II [Bacillus sp. FJAT-27225]